MINSYTEHLEIPNNYLCPITHKIMLEPVIAADDNIYERGSIEKWFETHDTSPVTGEVLSNNCVHVWDKNIEIKEFIEKNYTFFLSWALVQKHLKLLHYLVVDSEFLLNKLNQQDLDKILGAMFIAITNQDVESLQLALQATRLKKMINTPGANGNTLLHVTATLGQNNIVMLLLNAGADYDVLNLQDMTPLSLAIEHEKKQTAIIINKFAILFLLI